MSERFPPEITCKVLEEVAVSGDKKSLSVFGLTSRTWAYEARRHLLHTITYTQRSGGIVLADVTANLKNGHLVKEFVFYTYWESMHVPGRMRFTLCQIRQLLRLMPNLVVFRFHRIDLVPCTDCRNCFNSDCTRRMTRRKFKYIELVDIDAIRGARHPYSILEFACSVDTALLHFSAQDLIPADLLRHMGTLGITSLAFAMWPTVADNLDVNNIFTPPVQTLDLYDVRSKDRLAINRMLAGASDALQCLRVKFETYTLRTLITPVVGDEWLGSLSFRFNPSLNRVVLMFEPESSETHSKTIAAFIPSISPSISSLELVIMFDEHTPAQAHLHMHFIEWRNIAFLLSRIKTMRRLTITMTAYHLANLDGWWSLTCTDVERMILNVVPDMTVIFKFDHVRFFYESDGWARFDKDEYDGDESILVPSRILRTR